MLPWARMTVSFTFDMQIVMPYPKYVTPFSLYSYYLYDVTGTVKGTEYFKCPGNSKGLMLPINDVIRFKA